MTEEEQDVRLEVRDWESGSTKKTIGKGHFGVEGIRQRVRTLTPVLGGHQYDIGAGFQSPGEAE